MPPRGWRSAVGIDYALFIVARHRLRSFVADASHELRTPLSTMHGWIDLYVQGGRRDPDQLDHAMERMRAEVGRMRLRVDELALLAHLDAARPLNRGPVDVVALAGEVVEDARAGHHRPGRLQLRWTVLALSPVIARSTDVLLSASGSRSDGCLGGSATPLKDYQITAGPVGGIPVRPGRRCAKGQAVTGAQVVLDLAFQEA